MLLNRSPSWRQWSRPQPVNQAQDLGEQCSRYGDLCELECDIAAMSHNLGTDLDQLLPQRGQRPVLDLLRQRQCPQEVAEIISERMELKPDRIVAEAVAREAGPVDRILAFLDVLLGCAPALVELRYPDP